MSGPSILDCGCPEDGSCDCARPVLQFNTHLVDRIDSVERDQEVLMRYQQKLEKGLLAVEELIGKMAEWAKRVDARLKGLPEHLAIIDDWRESADDRLIGLPDHLAIIDDWRESTDRRLCHLEKYESGVNWCEVRYCPHCSGPVEV